MPLILKMILYVAKIALVVLVVCAILLLVAQRSLIYFPRAYLESDLSRFRALSGVELPFETSVGKQVAFYLPPEASAEGGPARVWLVCGGNGALALDYVDVAMRAGREQGYLFVDYPEYGSCEGRPSPKSTAANVEGAVEALAGHLGIPEMELRGRFSGFGHSIGAAVVLRAAADMEMRRVVVVAPFTAMMDLARKQVGFPLCHVLRHRFDNRAPLREIAAKGGTVILFHGGADRQIPVENGRALAALFPGTVEYHEIPDADHNGLIAENLAVIAQAMRPGN